MPSYVIPPAGVSAAGFPYASFVDVANPPALLADKIDPKTGEIVSMFNAPHPIDAAMAFGARTIRESGPALGDVGQRYLDTKKITESTVQALRAETERWVTPFVNAKWVRIESVDIQAPPDGDLGALVINYVNLMTGKNRTATSS